MDNSNFFRKKSLDLPKSASVGPVGTGEGREKFTHTKSQHTQDEEKERIYSAAVEAPARQTRDKGGNRG